MQKPRLNASQSDRAVTAASAVEAARTARAAAKAARVSAAAAQRSVLVAKAANNVRAAQGAHARYEREALVTAPFRHQQQLQDVCESLHEDKARAARVALADLQAARSLRALQDQSDQRAGDIANALSSGEARRLNLTTHVWEREKSDQVVEELGLRFAWSRCVGTAGAEAGGDWRDQVWALKDLYAALGQHGRDPTEVMVQAGGVVDVTAVSAATWRWMMGALSLKCEFSRRDVTYLVSGRFLTMRITRRQSAAAGACRGVA